MNHSVSRLHGLDFLRALMMSLGVVLHSAQIYLTLPFVYWDSARSPSMDATLIFINTFRMPVFYLLSGFFAALLLNMKGREELFKNRYRRIVIPFFLFLPLLAISMTVLKVISEHVMATGEFGFDIGLVDNPVGLLDNTHNFWFLYYLMFHIATIWLLLIFWGNRTPEFRNKLSQFVERTPMSSFPIFVVACLFLSLLGSLEQGGRLSADLSFVPNLAVYLYFGICFLLGWILYQRIQDLQALASHWKKNMVIATVLFVAGLVLFVLQGDAGNTQYYPLHTLLSLANGFSIGYYMLAFVGMFSRFFQAENPWIRYFSDSAYWIYILHSIPLVIIALLLHDWKVIAEVKFLVVCIGTLVICLLSYQLFVRKTKIGEILNGRRYTSVPWNGAE